MRRRNGNFILLSAPQTLLICAVTTRPMHRATGRGGGGGRFYTACTAPARPRDTFCYAHDVASARDLISLHGAQRGENKFDMEVSCRST